MSTTTSNHSIAEKKAFANDEKMGSTNSKRPAASEEVKYLSPTGLYPSCNWDLKTIRKLIIEKKLAPFYPGREEKDSPEHDECPICFMFYAGGLNQTKCCHKGVCTECFLQIKKPGAPLADSICPFCNRARFTVIFMGPKSREERMKEEMEEQKVLELQEKIRQEEIERDLERDKQKRQERDQDANKRDTQERVRTQKKATHTDGSEFGARSKGASGSGGPKQASGRSSDASTQGSAAGGPQFLPISPPGTSPEQDLEDLMLMEAIRLSLIDNSPNTASTDARPVQERSSSPSPEDSGDDRADDYRWAGTDGSSADVDLLADRRQSRPLRSGSSSSSSAAAAAAANNHKEKEKGEESDKEEDEEEPLHPLHPKYNPFAQLDHVEDVEEGLLVRKRGASAGRSSSSSS